MLPALGTKKGKKMQTREQYDQLVEHRIFRLQSRIQSVRLPPIAAVLELRNCLAQLAELLLEVAKNEEG